MRDITKALELGAAGYIPKTTSLEVMLGALKLVFSGGVYIPPEILEGKPPPKGEPGCGGSL
jgi:DNA-binding NarL/FixJ family response regulator